MVLTLQLFRLDHVQPILRFIVDLLIDFSRDAFTIDWILPAVAVLSRVVLMYWSSFKVVALGLPDLLLVEYDHVSRNLSSVRCTAPFDTFIFAAILRCENPSLLNAIICPLIPSLSSLTIFGPGTLKKRRGQDYCTS